MGRLPERTTISPACSLAKSSSKSPSNNPPVTVSPGSLISVLVWPSGSTTFRLVRVSPSAKWKWDSSPRLSRADKMDLPVPPPKIPTAMLFPPSLLITLDTLIPFPPGSVRMAVIRFTLSMVKDGISTVLSSAGFNVTV